MSYSSLGKFPNEGLNRGLDSRSSRNVLNRHTAERFAGDPLFARIARAVCEAECLPRKELFEAWESAKRIRRQMRGGPIVELAAGHPDSEELFIEVIRGDDRAFLRERYSGVGHTCGRAVDSGCGYGMDRTFQAGFTPPGRVSEAGSRLSTTTESRL